MDAFEQAVRTIMNTTSDQQFGKLSESIHKLEYVSGYSLNMLIDLFAAGYTLTPPEQPISMEELTKSLEEK